MDRLNLYFPQWQGSGTTNEIYNGAFLIRKELATEISFVEIMQPAIEKLIVENNILGYQRIKKSLLTTSGLLQNLKPQKIFTVGGDCGVEICPISYLNKIYESNMNILWIDAHADLNTPESSPSKTFHGMPLRLLLGEGDSQLKQSLFSYLKPEQIILYGTRDLDKPEEKYIQEKNISTNTITKSNLYIHLDLDVIDPLEIPDVKCPSPNGVGFEKLKEMLTQLKSKYNIAGASLVEYAPKSKKINEEVAELAKIIFL